MTATASTTDRSIVRRARDAWQALASLSAFDQHPYVTSSRMLRWILVRRLGIQPVVRMPTLGIRMHLSSGGGDYFILRDEYEPELKIVRALLKPGMVFADVGSHYGLYTLVASSAVGEQGMVLAFEADPSTFQVLQRNVHLNNCRNVRAFQAAVSAADGESSFFLDTYDMQHSLFREAPRSTGGRLEHIVTRALDGVLGESGMRRVDVMKVDVEGAELFVFQGAAHAIAQSKPVIVFEVNPSVTERAGVSAKAPWDFLQALGYQFSVVGAAGQLEPADWERVQMLTCSRQGREYCNVIARHSAAC